MPRHCMARRGAAQLCIVIPRNTIWYDIPDAYYHNTCVTLLLALGAIMM